MARKIVIIGGVAGGASAAARLRRLDESAEIIVFERGPYVSFANCGLPYYLSREIASEDKLLVQTPERLKAVFNLDVRVRSEVVAIDRAGKSVLIRDLAGGREYRESYDSLLLSPGASPFIPSIPGIDRPGIFTLRNIPDLRQIDNWVGDHRAKRAVVGGGGYIGLEVAEQLKRRGLEVTLAQSALQVLAPLDPEMAAHVHAELRKQGIRLFLGQPIVGFEAASDSAAPTVVLKDGIRLQSDIVVLGLGVKPEVKLAREAGLVIGDRGGIRVDEHLRTSDPDIYAVGDAVEVRDLVTGRWALIALAGPANRMGRIVADNMVGRPTVYEGSLGTAIVRVFDVTAASTGANEATLKRAGVHYEVVHLHPNSHAGYYPGAKSIALKVLFSPGTGSLLGAQAVGEDGVDKRIDVLATALKARMTVHDLADLELAYAPPFGSAKDPINLAGMAAQNILAGDIRVAQWHEVDRFDPQRTVILDVRDAGERAKGAIPNSIHVPLTELRERMAELPRERELLVHCASGQRSYIACRMLQQHGFQCRNLTGSYKTWVQATNGHGQS